MDLHEQVYDELTKRGGTQGDLDEMVDIGPIAEVVLGSGIRSEDTNVLFIHWIKAQRRGAFSFLLDAILDAVAAQGLEPRTVLLMLSATQASERFWKRAGFRPFADVDDAHALYSEVDTQDLTPMWARLSQVAASMGIELNPSKRRLLAY